MPTLGVTLACFSDLGPRFEVARTDEQICRDEAYHRLTTDAVYGDSDEARNWGYNLKTRVNAASLDSDVLSLGPLLSNVLKKSPRLDDAEVTVTQASDTPGIVDLFVNVYVVPTSGTGPFAFLFRLTGDTFQQVGAQPGG